MQHERHLEPEALIDLRTHLTVMSLAVAQLHRRHGEEADIDRLCAIAEGAMSHVKEDIAAIEALLPPSEGHVAPTPRHLRAIPAAVAGGQGQDTGPMVVPTPTPRADVHGQETGAIPLPPDIERDRPR